MRDFLFKAVLLLCSFCAHQAALNAADLHAILVGDFVSADIQRACQVDLKDMAMTIEKIAKYGNFNLHLTQIAGNEPTAKKVLKAVQNLKVRKDDCVIFYYSGHGFRLVEDGKSPWPNFTFPLEHVRISMNEIIHAISAKGANLSIVLADCCNVYIAKTYAAPALKGKKNRISSERLKANYQALFCQAKGVIAIVSSSQGQPSYCNSQGSFYTYSFLDSLHKVVESQANAEWTSVFDGALDYLNVFLDLHKIKQDPIVYTNF